QAEDGIRDLYVTGVQTCALPILRPRLATGVPLSGGVFSLSGGALVHGGCQAGARGGPRCLKIWKLRGLEGTCRVRSAYPCGPGERRPLSCLTVHAPILAPLSSRIVYLSETYDYSRFRGGPPVSASRSSSLWSGSR